MAYALWRLAAYRLGIHAGKQRAQRLGILGLKTQISTSVTRLAKTRLELIDKHAQGRAGLGHELA